MAVAAAPPVKFDLGRVFNAGFLLVMRRPLPILVLALLFGFLPTVGVAWAIAQLVRPPAQIGAPADLGAAFGRLGIIEVIAFVAAGFGWILQGGVAVIATADATGRTVTEHLVRSIGRAPLIYVVGFVATIGIFFATLLLIVPGVLVSLAWAVCPAVAAVEGKGFLDTFRRSADLTRGCRGALFGIFLLYGLGSAVLGVVLRLAVGVPLLAGGGPLPPIYVFLLQPALGALTAAILAAVIAAAYLELRGVKEGLATDGLAAMFD